MATKKPTPVTMEDIAPIAPKSAAKSTNATSPTMQDIAPKPTNTEPRKTKTKSSKSSATMEAIAPPETTTKKPTSNCVSPATPQQKETIAMMVIKRKHDLENEFATKLDAKVNEVYNTAVKMVGEMPINGVLRVTISSRSEITVKIFNSKSEVTINWLKAECEDEHRYIQKASMTRLEKLLTTEGFRKSESQPTDIVIYSISM